MKYIGEEEMKGNDVADGGSLICGAQDMVHSQKHRETPVLDRAGENPSSCAAGVSSHPARPLPPSHGLPSAFRESLPPELVAQNEPLIGQVRYEARLSAGRTTELHTLQSGPF